MPLDKSYCIHCKVFDDLDSELEVLEDGKELLRDTFPAYSDRIGCSTLSVLYTTKLVCTRCNSIYEMVYRKK